MKKRKLIKEFRVISEAGKEYAILEYQEFSDDTPVSKYLCTSGGLDVNFIAPDTFKIVVTDEIVKTL